MDVDTRPRPHTHTALLVFHVNKHHNANRTTPNKMELVSLPPPPPCAGTVMLESSTLIFERFGTFADFTGDAGVEVRWDDGLKRFKIYVVEDMRDCDCFRFRSLVVRCEDYDDEMVEIHTWLVKFFAAWSKLERKPTRKVWFSAAGLEKHDSSNGVVQELAQNEAAADVMSNFWVRDYQ